MKYAPRRTPPRFHVVPRREVTVATPVAAPPATAPSSTEHKTYDEKTPDERLAMWHVFFGIRPHKA